MLYPVSEINVEFAKYFKNMIRGFLDSCLCNTYGGFGVEGMLQDFLYNQKYIVEIIRIFLSCNLVVVKFFKKLCTNWRGWLIITCWIYNLQKQFVFGPAQLRWQINIPELDVGLWLEQSFLLLTNNLNKITLFYTQNVLQFSE